MSKPARTSFLPARWSSVACILLSVAMVLTALCSWLGSRYGFPLQNLLGTDGIRWLLRHAVSYFRASPAANVFVLLLGGGIMVRSGLLKSLTMGVRQLFGIVGYPMHLSLRQRRALLLAGMVVVIYVAALIAGVYGAQGFLLGVKGGWAHSPIAKGFPLLFSLGMGLAGGIYGFSAGRLQTMGDLLQGSSVLISRAAPAFVLMFLGSLWLSMLDYTSMNLLLGVEHGTWGRTFIELFIFWGFPLLQISDKV